MVPFFSGMPHFLQVMITEPAILVSCCVYFLGSECNISCGKLENNRFGGILHQCYFAAILVTRRKRLDTVFTNSAVFFFFFSGSVVPGVFWAYTVYASREFLHALLLMYGGSIQGCCPLFNCIIPEFNLVILGGNDQIELIF